MSTISTHVLDTALGRPAAGVQVTLERLAADGRELPVGEGRTDDDGRLRELLPAGVTLGAGTYRLRFAVDAYFVRTERVAFFPEIEVTFRIGEGGEHYHVPVLLSPFGYATYRGS
jgi:5-hydroxyisourate hydrolase